MILTRKRKKNPSVVSPDIYKIWFDPAPCSVSALVTQQCYCNLMLITSNYVS